MNTLDTIRREVFQHLIERYYQDKERGEDFFFIIKSLTAHGYQFPFYYLPELHGQEVLSVFFYNTLDRSPIAYLIISEKSSVYLTIEFESTRDTNESINSFDQLRRYAQNYLRVEGINGVEASYNQQRIQSVYKFSYKGIISSINLFLYEIKPAIDQCLGGLRLSTSYLSKMLFFKPEDFDKYLKTEKAYIPPQITLKKDLAIASFKVTNFHGITYSEIKDLPASARWIILTGRNGYGKTSVLQAIAAGLYGNYDESGRELVPDNAFVGISYYAMGELVSTDSRAPRTESADKKLNHELATYGSSRLQVTANVSSDTIEKQIPPTYSLFNPDGLLLNVEQLLTGSKPYSPGFFDQLVDLFKALIPQLDRIEIKTEKRIPQIRYFEKDDNGKPITESEGLSFSQLAAGFRNIIAMIGDLVYRLSSNQEVENLRDLQGIVLIDEFELHLHPIYQKLLPEVLTELFPHIQFIVSTHSPIPLLGIPKGTGVVLLHVLRSAETGIMVERLDIDFSTLTPNAILSSPIFGFHDLIPDSKPDDQMVRTEDEFNDVIANKNLRKNITEFLTPERQKELLNLIRKK